MCKFDDRPEALHLKGEDWTQSERRLAQAQEAGRLPVSDGPPDNPQKPPGDSQKPLEQGNWRYYDPELRGHVYTRLEHPNALEPKAVAVLHGNDGTVREVGRLRYALDTEDCMLRGYTLQSENYGVETALQSEVSEQARAKGIHNMQVWVPDSDSDRRWSSHGFLEGARNPGAQGVHWNRRL